MATNQGKETMNLIEETQLLTDEDWQKIEHYMQRQREHIEAPSTELLPLLCPSLPLLPVVCLTDTPLVAGDTMCPN